MIFCCHWCLRCWHHLHTPWCQWVRNHGFSAIGGASLVFFNWHKEINEWISIWEFSWQRFWMSQLWILGILWLCAGIEFNIHLQIQTQNWIHLVNAISGSAGSLTGINASLVNNKFSFIVLPHFSSWCTCYWNWEACTCVLSFSNITSIFFDNESCILVLNGCVRL